MLLYCTGICRCAFIYYLKKLLLFLSIFFLVIKCLLFVLKSDIDKSDGGVRDTSMSYLALCALWTRVMIYDGLFFRRIVFDVCVYKYVLFHICVETNFMDSEEFCGLMT